MPALSPTMSQGNIAAWKVAAGASIKPGSVVAEIETDKATVDLEVQEEGILAKFLFEAGAKDIAVGTPIAVLVEHAEDVAAFADFKAPPAPASAKAAVAAVAAATPASAKAAVAAAIPASAKAAATAATPPPSKPNVATPPPVSVAAPPPTSKPVPALPSPPAGSNPLEALLESDRRLYEAKFGLAMLLGPAPSPSKPLK